MNNPIKPGWFGRLFLLNLACVATAVAAVPFLYWMNPTGDPWIATLFSAGIALAISIVVWLLRWVITGQYDIRYK